MGDLPARTLTFTFAAAPLLGRAFEWLCHRRRDYPAHDIWSLITDALSFRTLLRPPLDYGLDAELFRHKLYKREVPL